MGSEGKTSKRQVGLRVPLEICRAVEKKFYRPEDGDQDGPAFVRALDFATQDIVLTQADRAIIQKEIDANKQDRQQKRAGTYQKHPGKKRKRKK